MQEPALEFVFNSLKQIRDENRHHPHASRRTLEHLNRSTLEKIEVAYLSAALRRTGGKKTAAAALLQMDPQRMKYLCRKHRIA